MKKKLKKEKQEIYNSEMAFDGDTGECLLQINLKTKNETKALKVANKIIKLVNVR
jgi:DNA-binding protein YbaB